jgi:hypothetical protein
MQTVAQKNNIRKRMGMFDRSYFVAMPPMDEFFQNKKNDNARKQKQGHFEGIFRQIFIGTGNKMKKSVS